MFDSREVALFTDVASGFAEPGDGLAADLRAGGSILVHVVGSRELNNQLLAFYLQMQGTLECRLYAHVRSLSSLSGRLPDVVLLDMQDKDLTGLRRELSEIEEFDTAFASRTCLALFNLERSEELELASVRLGIKGFFYHNDSPQVFLKGIEAINRGELWVSRRLLSSLVVSNLSADSAEAPGLEGLSHREQEILWLVQQGRRNHEIAEKLFISPHTVKTHIYNIFRKIDVSNRMQAANWARQNLPERFRSGAKGRRPEALAGGRVAGLSASF